MGPVNRETARADVGRDAARVASVAVVITVVPADPIMPTGPTEVPR